MRIYLDTADPTLWSLPEGCPALHGVTTNPTLIHRAGFPVTLETYRHLVHQAGVRRIPELMLQAPRPDPEEISAWLEELLPAAAISRTRLVIKVPCHPGWLDVIHRLRQLDIPMLLTGLSNPIQLLWARSVGADFVAPYLGRIEAKGQNPWPLIEACVRLQESGVKLVAASIRDQETLTRLVALGSYSATVQPSFIQALVLDEITLEAIDQFNGDIARSMGHPSP
ncbi:MAG: Fructose-6-phosphate aldolase 1 [Pseudomonadota bacterium]